MAAVIRVVWAYIDARYIVITARVIPIDVPFHLPLKHSTEMPSISLLRAGVLLLSTISSITALPYNGLAIRQEAPCQEVHIFLAKGGNEPYPGRQGKLAGAICYGLPSCDYEDIQYYNANGSDYCAGVSEGDRNGLAQITAYANRCPDAKLVLSGYSQGANIVGDLIGGGGGVIFNECTVDPSPALDPATSPGNKRKCYPFVLPRYSC